MESLIYTPAYELFLVLEAMSSRYKEWASALVALQSEEAPTVLGADAYYRAHTDVALIALRYDERALSFRELAYVLELARGVGAHVLDPSRLEDKDRREFYHTYLGDYDVRLEDLPNASVALAEIGRRLGMERSQAATHSEAPKRLPTALPSTRAPTRRLGSQPPAAMKPRAATPPAATPPAAMPSITRGGRARTVRWAPPSATKNASPPRIAVRYLRNGRWAPARLGALSTKSAYIVTSGLPHKGESVNLALGFQDIGAMISGHVSHVTTVENAVDAGLSGFALRLVEDAAERSQLMSLLRHARAAGVRIQPPPARREVRFPVRWPVRIGTSAGGFRASALDLSSNGLFVATHNHLDRELMFQLPMDNDEPPVTGRAEIKREISSEVAKARGLASGYGLHITELSAHDRNRFGEFLRRIKERSAKRVVVCADEKRARGLTDELARAGYAVRAGNDAGALIRIADTEPRIPDVVVIDESLAARGLCGDWIDQVFSGARVRCVMSANESGDATRQAVDRALHLAA